MIMIVKTPGSQMGSPAAHNCWVHRDILTADVPELVKAFDTRPSTFKARASAPKRATKGYMTPVVKHTPRRRPGLRSGDND